MNKHLGSTFSLEKEHEELAKKLAIAVAALERIANFPSTHRVFQKLAITTLTKIRGEK